MRFISSIILFEVIFLAVVCAQPENSPSDVINSFFKLIIEQKYEKAYFYLSLKLQKEVSFKKFKEEAFQAKNVKLTDLVILDRDEHLTRLKLKGKVLWKENSKLIWVAYEGKAYLIKEAGKWRIFSVDFEPVAKNEIKAIKGSSVDLGKH